MPKLQVLLIWVSLARGPPRVAQVVPAELSAQVRCLLAAPSPRVQLLLSEVSSLPASPIFLAAELLPRGPLRVGSSLLRRSRARRRREGWGGARACRWIAQCQCPDPRRLGGDRR